jgi:hypothetical protein
VQKRTITNPFSISLIDSAIMFRSVLESIGEPLYKLQINLAFISQFGPFLNGCPFRQSITNRKKDVNNMGWLQSLLHVRFSPLPYLSVSLIYFISSRVIP